MAFMRILATRLTSCLFCALLASCATTGGGEWRPDLNDGIAQRVASGQTSADVAARMGLPYQRIRFDNLRATAWDYRYRDTWGYWVEFSVMIGDDDRVVNIVSRRMDVDQGSP